MKKALSMFFVFIIILSSVSVASAHPNNISEYIFVVRDDEAVVFGDEKPFTIDGYTYVPDYTVHDWLSVGTDWVDSEKKLIISRGFLKVEIFERENRVAFPNGNMQIKLYRTNGVLMVPLELVAQKLCFRVSYLANEKIVRVTTGREKLSNEEIGQKFISQINREKKNFSPAVTGEKIAYLTFDDGPSANTSGILDILKKHNVKATFFMLESGMRKYPNIVKRMAEEGHSLGLHGVTHQKNKFYATAWSPTIEMEQANAALKEITGLSTAFVRVPYGSSPNLTNSQYQNLKNTGFLMWDWNVDSEDSLAANVKTQTIYNNTINGVKNKKTAVLLFHDKSNIINCLENIIIYLKNNGYTIVGITDSTSPINWKER